MQSHKSSSDAPDTRDYAYSLAAFDEGLEWSPLRINFFRVQAQYFHRTLMSSQISGD